MSDPRDPADQFLTLAATHPDLGDDEFVMVSRALQGRNPLTGVTEPPPPRHFFVAPDHDGDEALWVGVDPDTDAELVSYRFELDRHPVLWPALVAALDGKPEGARDARTV